LQVARTVPAPQRASGGIEYVRTESDGRHRHESIIGSGSVR
jgi:hypothetical protein